MAGFKFDNDSGIIYFDGVPLLTSSGSISELLDDTSPQLGGDLDANGFDIQLQDGSASAPSLTFGTDTDTGLYRSGTNQLSITTGGQAQIVVDSSGTQINDNLFVDNNTNLGTTLGDTVEVALFQGENTNTANLYFELHRFTQGSPLDQTWNTSEFRIRKRIDATDMSWVSFRGSNATSGSRFVIGHNSFGDIAEFVGTGETIFNDDVRFATGSAAAPSITFQGDLDSGFYSIGANSIGLTLGGTLQVDFSGDEVDFQNNDIITTGNTTISGTTSRIANHLFGSTSLELGQYGTGNRNALIDFHNQGTFGGSPGIVDYNARIIKWTPTTNDGDFSIINQTEGSLRLTQNVSDGLLAISASAGTTPEVRLTSASGGSITAYTGGSKALEIASARIRGTSGGASNPTFSFFDDTDTGIYRSGADEISFTTNSTQRVLIDDSRFYSYNSMVIDTAAPILEFAEDLGGSPEYKNWFIVADGSTFQIRENSTAGTNKRISFNANHGGIQFYTQQTEVFRIQTDGSLSVHTANYENLVTADDDIPNKKYVDDSIVSGALQNIVEDTTPQLGGDLDANGFDIQLQDGTASAPSLTFGSDTNTGMYRVGAEEIGFSTGGTLRTKITSTGTEIISSTFNEHLLITRNVGSPVQTWSISPSTDGSLNFGRLSGSGTSYVEFSGIRLAVGDGTAALPSYAFTGDTDTGMYLSGTNDLRFTVGGTELLKLSGSTAQLGNVVSGNSGLEIGPTNHGVADATAYVDFHTGFNNDYDVRLQATSGTNGTPGEGTLNILASTVGISDATLVLSGQIETGSAGAKTRYFNGGFSTTITGSTIYELGRFAITGNSHNITVVGEVKGRTSATLGLTRFILAVRSDTLPGKSFNFSQEKHNLGKEIDIHVYDQTNSGEVVIAFVASADLQNINWTLSLAERTDYDYFTEVTSLTTFDPTGSPTYTEVTETADRPVSFVDNLFQVGDGSAGAPAYSFDNDTDTGFYSISADRVGLSLGGSLEFDFVTGGKIRVEDTSGALFPGFSFIDDPDTGMYNVAADELGWALGGSLKMELHDRFSGTTYLNVAGKIECFGGDASNPAIVNTADLNTGMYWSGTDELAFSTAGTRAAYFDSSQRLVIPATNATIWMDTDGVEGTKRIACNDGGGNWNFQGNSSGGATPTYQVTGDGAIFQRMMFEGIGGSFEFRVAGTGTAGNAISWDNELEVTTSYTSTLQPIRGPDGSAGAPSYTFSSDTDTGMYQSTAGYINFTTGGIERFQIRGDGSLVVATTNYETLVTNDDDIPNKKYVDDAISAGGSTTMTATTTDATETELSFGGSPLTYYVPGNNAIELITVKVVARRTDVVGGDGYGAWKFEIAVGNEAGEVTAASAALKTVLSNDDAYDADVSVDTTNDRLAIKVTGAASKTIDWRATITEVITV